MSKILIPKGVGRQSVLPVPGSSLFQLVHWEHQDLEVAQKSAVLSQVVAKCSRYGSVPLFSMLIADIMNPFDSLWRNETRCSQKYKAFNMDAALLLQTTIWLKQTKLLAFDRIYRIRSHLLCVCTSFSADAQTDSWALAAPEWETLTWFNGWEVSLIVIHLHIALKICPHNADMSIAF